MLRLAQLRRRRECQKQCHQLEVRMTRKAKRYIDSALEAEDFDGDRGLGHYTWR